MSNSNPKNKKRVYYIITAATIALVIAIVSVVVMIADKAPWKYDMTSQKLFTLSEQTTAVLSELEQPVTIAGVYATGHEEKMVQSLLKEYEKASDKVIVEYIDVEREPAKLAKYNLTVAAITNGSLIVKSGENIKIINGTNLFEDTTEGRVFNGEREITGAIKYVNAKEMPVAYFVTGHEEANTTKVMQKAISALQLDTYEVKEVSLTQDGGVPKDAKVLIFTSPKTDITAEELTMLQEYAKTGGKVMIMLDSVMNTNDIQLPNLDKFTRDFGISIPNNYVVEENSQNYLSTQKLYLIPQYAPHEITMPIAEAKKLVILPVGRGLSEVEYDKNVVKLTPLLMSSDLSWMRMDMAISSSERTETDIAGPIPLGYASTRSNVKWGNDEARLVVIGNGSFAYDGNIEVQANRELFVNSVNWLLGDRENDVIASKVINSSSLIIRGTDFSRLAMICLVAMPGIALLAAFLTWLIRRNR
ncbi:MAG: GldG family protein [Christensenellaceae bacterium]